MPISFVPATLPPPAAGRDGDWRCGCGANVFASKASCYRCGAPRAVPAGGREV
eukprot:gene27780-7551_t